MEKFNIGDSLKPQLRVGIYKDMIKRNKEYFEKVENMNIHKNRAVFQQAMKALHRYEKNVQERRRTREKGVNPNKIRLNDNEIAHLLKFVNKIDVLADQAYFVTRFTLLMKYNDIKKIKRMANEQDRRNEEAYKKRVKGEKL